MKGELLNLRPGDLIPWPGLNPRRHFDREWLEELTASIRDEGVLQPLLVDSKNSPDAGIGWVVAGETRWRAAVAAGVETIPCIVREYTLAEALKVALLENLQRKDLTAIEEARGFKRLLEETGCTQTELADQVGKSQPYVANRIRLLELPGLMINLIDEGIIPPATARDVLLPFAQLAEKWKGAFFKAVLKDVENRRKLDEGAISAADLRVIAVNAGQSMSKSVQKGEGWGDNEVLIGPKDHEACSCGAPSYRWNRWNNETSVRCFDAAWWKRANEAAHAARKEALAKQLIKAVEKAAQMGGAIISHQQLDKLVPYTDRAEIAYAGEMKVSLSDPSLLPAESLVWVRRNPGDKVLALYCTDKTAAARAQKAADRELRKRFAVRQKQILDEDLAAIAETDFDASLLAPLFTALDDYSARAAIQGVAKDLGLEGLDAYDREKYSKVPAGDLVRLAMLIARRSARGDLTAYNPQWQQKIQAALRKEYEALLPPPPEEDAAPKKPGARARRREKAVAEVGEAVGV